MKTTRRPALTAAIVVLAALGALVQLLPAPPHEAHPIDPTRILPLDTRETLFPQR